ncbi:MAG: signal peptidase I [Clostridiales bacterium]|nr:signal peptidase I [Clostridiales bacterium]
MKKILYGALLGLILITFLFTLGSKTSGAPILTYVYSNSMEPLIKVNDAFLVWPTKDVKPGDIVMFRPVVLNAPYITHRIMEIGDTGFITKGDNSPYPDQESGEPEVVIDRVVGKVVTINGQPLVIPGLGKISAGLQSSLGRYSRFASLLFLLLGIRTSIYGKRHNKKRKPRHRLRLKHVYRALTIVAICTVVIIIYLGSRVTQIRYLVSEFPASQGDQVEVNKLGQLTMDIKNNGFVPVWTIVKGVAPLSVTDAPEYLWPRSKEIVVLDVLPHEATGMYQGYIQIFNYPILLPRPWIVAMHQINPILAIALEGIAMGFWFKLIFYILGHFHGFEDWIPLRAIRDKIANRRMRRAKAKFLGRRRGG